MLARAVIWTLVLISVRARVTPGLCFDLKLPTGGRYEKNLGHQAEAIFPLLAEATKHQPAIIVAREAPPLAYFQGLFRAVLPGTALFNGRRAAGCKATKEFHPSSQNMNFRIGPAVAELRRHAYITTSLRQASCAVPRWHLEIF